MHCILLFGTLYSTIVRGQNAPKNKAVELVHMNQNQSKKLIQSRGHTQNKIDFTTNISLRQRLEYCEIVKRFFQTYKKLAHFSVLLAFKAIYV